MRGVAFLAFTIAGQLLALHWYGWHGFVVVIVVQSAAAVLQPRQIV